MLKAGNKHPLKESLGVAGNSGPSRVKRRRFDNVILLREEEENSENPENNGRQAEAPRPILRAGRKRKKPSEEKDCVTSSVSTASTSSAAKSEAAPENDENDIISELAKEFKKARLRPVFFTISSFIEQTVDEVGFTMADEPETEVTVRLNLTLARNSNGEPKKVSDPSKDDVEKGLQTEKSSEVNESPPDLIKDCDDHHTRRYTIRDNSKSVSVKHENNLNLVIVSDGTHHEINNNNERNTDFVNVMMDELELTPDN